MAAPLRGLAESVTAAPYACADLATIGSSLPWQYSWGPAPAVDPATCAGLSTVPEFVPMVWGKTSLNHTFYTKGVTAILGFNEPNHAGQANMLPAQAAALWPQLEALASRNGWRIGSPAAAPCGGKCTGGDYLEWFDAFFGNCTGCKVDFLATHDYSCSASGLTSFLQSLQKYKLPIWLTEFNCGDGPRNASAPEHLAYMQAALPVLDADPSVERYAWMSSRPSGTPGAALLTGPAGGPATLTAVGKLYTTHKREAQEAQEAQEE